jgi:N-formylglutamate amidohydrolase
MMFENIATSCSNGSAGVMFRKSGCQNGKNSGLKNKSSSSLFQISKPAQCRVPFVFNSPHSGREYPREFLVASKLDEIALRRSEDFLVDELFACAVPTGAPLLSARFPRAWLDVNREPYELDPAMFEDPLPDFVNAASARVAGGLGTIARIVSEAEEIYDTKLNAADALNRIETAYHPYHETLQALLAEAIVHFGHAVLVDCHSMPSAANTGAKSAIRADFVLGDRYGTSCAPSITGAAAQILTDLGYRVAINKPYAGGFITEHYGRPANGLHAIQIEINRSLYMDEERMRKSAGFEPLLHDLQAFVARLVSIPEQGLEASTPLAAE